MTPREPDRFDKQAREIVEDLDVAMGRACGHTHISHHDPKVREYAISMVAAALRAAESSALERAAQVADAWRERSVAVAIRALIPPAAAPAAEPRLDNLAAESPAPAAETGKAQALEININDSVWVKVTAVGEQIYRQHWIALRMDPLPLRRDADGWTKFQLWELANVFGAAMYNGGRVPVETTIRIAAPARAAPPEGEGK